MNKQQKFASGALGLTVLFLVVLLFVLFRSPEFPDHLPSAETTRQNQTGKDQNRKLFQQFLASMQEYHGGHISFREVHEPSAAADEFNVIEQLQYINEEALVKSLHVFSGNQNLQLKSFNSFEEAGQLFPERGVATLEKNGITQLVIQFEARQKRSDALAGNTEYLKTEDPHISEEPAVVDMDGPVKGKLVIVIDDLGYNLGLAEKFLDIDAPLTYAVLPQLQYSHKIVEMVQKKKRDLLLHQPMQPMGWPDINPGPGTLFVSDDLLKKQKVWLKNLKSMPEMLGVNNHMGSAFTTDEESMRWFMQQMSRRSLFFLDSKTGPGKVSRKMASEFGVPFLARDVFLDNHQDMDATREQLEKAVKIAVKFGKAIAIGHPFKTTLDVLKEQMPELKKKGIQVISIRELLQSSQPTKEAVKPVQG
jgi:polysaccharide deacetylase 2 family uncharacterized protein YibQ